MKKNLKYVLLICGFTLSITYANNIIAPTLIIHSENDYRCPIEQGEQLFSNLKRRGVESAMMRFPAESHELSRSG